MFTHSTYERYLSFLSIMENLFGLSPFERTKHQSFWNIKDTFTREFVEECAKYIGVTVCGHDQKNPNLLWICESM